MLPIQLGQIVEKQPSAVQVSIRLSPQASSSPAVNMAGTKQQPGNSSL
jgi:hypothetical protein